VAVKQARTIMAMMGRRMVLETQEKLQLMIAAGSKAQN
jgi:hypothetical protein